MGLAQAHRPAFAPPSNACVRVMKQNGGSSCFCRTLGTPKVSLPPIALPNARARRVRCTAVAWTNSVLGFARDTDAQLGRQPDAPVHAFYFASISAARRERAAPNVRFSSVSSAGVGRLPALARVDPATADWRTAVSSA
jgi:hypothetical protein